MCECNSIPESPRHFLTAHSDVLHPNRPNVSKDELRTKLSEMYKANKDAVSVFGFRTQYGGGKSTGFALVYDSPEALKKFEPNYRLVRYSLGVKVEKASRQQRTCLSRIHTDGIRGVTRGQGLTRVDRQATQEQIQGVPRNGQDQGQQEEGQGLNVGYLMTMMAWLSVGSWDGWQMVMQCTLYTLAPSNGNGYISRARISAFG